MLIGDIVGFGPIAMTANEIYVAEGPRNGADSICKFPIAGGGLSCFASVTPHTLADLHAVGEWLFGRVIHFPGGPTIARIHQERGEVHYQRVGEEEEWSEALEVDGEGGLCLALGRPGPGHAERALFRVSRAGGPRKLLVPYGKLTNVAIACDATHAYFMGDEGLARVPLSGGTPRVLGTSGYQIALGPRHVFVATNRGIERLVKGQTSLTVVAPVPHSGLGWNPVRAIVASSDTVAWVERTFPHDRPAETPSRIRRCQGTLACETILETPAEPTLVSAAGGLVVWVMPTRTRYGSASGIFAARGGPKLFVPDALDSR